MSLPETTATRARRGLWLFTALLWTVIVLVGFDQYASEINEFNARVRLLLRTGQTNSRVFDHMGLPVSYSARTGQAFVSPFYVVHYGLIYSDVLPNRDDRHGFHWRRDAALEHWDVPPTVISAEFFKVAADWVVENINRDHGQAHLIYDFDFAYNNYPNGGLSAPWWSGLADGYAIVLLLRAYDVFQDERYRGAARELYESVLTPVDSGGSMVRLGGAPWIEEYVDPSAGTDSMSFVLNGMIYASYGVDAFERHEGDTPPVAPRLYEAIARNLELFDLSDWSYYDRLGNVANLKYHSIHVRLLEDLERIQPHEEFRVFRERWRVGLSHPGWNWLVKSNWTVSHVHFAIVMILLLLPAAAIVMAPLLRRGVRVARRRGQQGGSAGCVSK